MIAILGFERLSREISNPDLSPIWSAGVTMSTDVRKAISSYLINKRYTIGLMG